MNWRVVYNEQTHRYRIERRRWWGWDFVLNPKTGAYLAFDDYDSARNWVCRNLIKKDPSNRRWRVMSICDRVTSTE